MRLRIDANLDYHFAQAADVLLALEVAQLPDQILVEDKLLVGTATPLTPVAGHQGIGRRIWTRGDGRFTVSYRATVDVLREVTDLAHVRAVPLTELPGRAIHYLWPSRYCRPDRLKEFATERFGGFEGGARAVAIAEWTRASLVYTPGCSNEQTDALDTFEQKQGICRDFAHVMITLARAVDIPARMVSAYGWNLNPQDFHAVVEVYLDGGWYLIDPTGMAPVDGLVRIAVGRDAADISFMTIFGSAKLSSQSVRVERVD